MAIATCYIDINTNTRKNII